MIEDLKPLLKRFIVFAKDNLNFQRPPRLFLKQDTANQKCMLGRTAHYDPQNQAVTLYISGRHPKDILRSFAHELVHHCQHERGDLHPDKMKTMNQNYAQENDHMRKMEKEAYLQGNMCFRDWEDGLDDKLQYKMKLAEQKFLKENKTMSVKISKKELKNLIQKLLENKSKEGQLEEGSGCGHAPGKRESCGERGCPSCGDSVNEAEEAKKCPECGAETKMKDGKEVCGSCEAEVTEENGKRTSDCECKEKSETAPGVDEKLADRNNDGKLDSWEKSVANAAFAVAESKVQTPEQENTLYESRFTQRNTRLFEKLLKEWTK